MNQSKILSFCKELRDPKTKDHVAKSYFYAPISKDWGHIVSSPEHGVLSELL